MQSRKAFTLGRRHEGDGQLKSIRSSDELLASGAADRPGSAVNTNNKQKLTNQLNHEHLESSVDNSSMSNLRPSASFAILDASSGGEEDEKGLIDDQSPGVAERPNNAIMMPTTSNYGDYDYTNGRPFYVTTSTGGIQPTAQFLESSEDQRFLARHFPDISTEPIQGAISCALERDVLWQGRLVYTGKHLCFRGRLFAKAIKIQVPFRDILAIEKKSTVLIPNGLRIVTLHSKHVFTSIIKRDTVFQPLCEAWKRELQHLAVKQQLKQKRTQQQTDAVPAGSFIRGSHTDLLSSRNNLSASSSSSSSATDCSNAQPSSSTSSSNVEGSAGKEPITVEKRRLSLSPVPSTHRPTTPNSAKTIAEDGSENLSMIMLLLQKNNENEVGTLQLSTVHGDTPVAGDETEQQQQLQQQSNSKLKSSKKKKHNSKPQQQQQKSSIKPDKRENFVKKTTSVSLFKNVVYKLGGGGSSRMPSLDQLTPLVEPTVKKGASGSNNSGSSEGGQEITLPTGRVECGCAKHLKHTIYNEVVDGVDVCQLFHLLFAAEGIPFMTAMQQARGTEGYQPPVEWQLSENGVKTRELTYTCVVKAPIPTASKTKCIERQEVKKEDRFAYSIETRPKTPNIPYGDAFDVVARYCLTHESLKSARLHVTVNVEFRKSLFWESMIEKGAVDGNITYLRDLTSALSNRLKSDPVSLLQNIPSLTRHNHNHHHSPTVNSKCSSPTTSPTTNTPTVTPTSGTNSGFQSSSPLSPDSQISNRSAAALSLFNSFITLPQTIFALFLSLSKENLITIFFTFNLLFSWYTFMQYQQFDSNILDVAGRLGLSADQVQSYIQYSADIDRDDGAQPKTADDRWRETDQLMDELRVEIWLQQKYIAAISPKSNNK